MGYVKGRTPDLDPPVLGKSPLRVVSLIPSVTESLFALGLGDTVVGVTDYCYYPGEALSSVARMGGTKEPRIDRILNLDPDFVIANQEENSVQTVQALQTANVPVWITFPTSVREALDVLWAIAGLFQCSSCDLQIRTIESMVDRAEAAVDLIKPVRYFCPIWSDQTGSGQPWWMTFNEQTYANDVLRILGGENLFAARLRKYPLAADLGYAIPEDPRERDTRYPRVTQEEINQGEPEVILLPDEPYPFDISDMGMVKEIFSTTPAVQQGQVYRVEGSLITWHGTRIVKAIRDLEDLFHSGLE